MSAPFGAPASRTVQAVPEEPVSWRWITRTVLLPGVFLVLLPFGLVLGTLGAWVRINGFRRRSSDRDPADS